MAEKTRLPRWKVGDPIKADDLNRLAEAIEAARVEVDGTTGLIPLQTPNGLKLSLRARHPFRYATITTQVEAYNASTRVYGKGAGTLEIEGYSSTGVCTGALTSPAITVDIYSGGKDVIVVGRRVGIYEKAPGRWHAILDFCP